MNEVQAKAIREAYALISAIADHFDESGVLYRDSIGLFDDEKTLHQHVAEVENLLRIARSK